MKILLGKGVDQILFGFTEKKAIEHLGKPDSTYETDDENKRIQYNNKRLELTFEPENDNLLGWIEVHNPEADLFGKKVIGLPRQDVLDFLKQHIGEPTETEDYGSFISTHYADHWLELQFKFDRLQNVNFGSLYDVSGDPIWPDE
ncbi:MAG: hypothetical protein ACRBDL_05675 [Alphaproteobacteria bacterium]